MSLALSNARSSSREGGLQLARKSISARLFPRVLRENPELGSKKGGEIWARRADEKILIKS